MTRAIWWILLLIAACVATFVQLDRASALNPALALAVPKAFRSSAQFVSAASAATAGTPDAAVSEAVRLVRRRPIPAEHLFVLAVARQRAGDAEGFAAAFRLATTRGWRSEPVQLLAARSAMQKGDADAAALRIAALWALHSTSPALRDLTRKLLAMPHGPQALADLARDAKLWRDQLMREAPAISSPGDLLRLEAALKEAGQPGA